MTSAITEARVLDLPDLTGLAGMKLGNYRLERLVGRGRMGAVYVAKDEALLRPTAIKILAWRAAEAHGQDPVQWFLAEARLVARINHPRVVQIYGAARHGEHCYIAMEYVAGTSAEAAVAQGGPMAPEAATDVLLQAASALHAAHRAGVVHRDVKPANLLIGAGGIAKLGDFGMALGLAELRTGSAHLRVGTPYYTAPEIWRGEAATASCDIYSLGATYFQLLTGRPPFPAADVAGVEQAHLRAPVPDPRELVPTLPASCAALVKRALAKSPRDRHAGAQELLWEGRRVLQDLASGPAPAAASARAAPAPGSAARCGPAVAPSLPLQGPLAEVLGFARRPFSAVDPSACPYLGEPFASIRDRVLARIEDDATPALALVGPAGSGRSALARRVAAELSASRLVLVAEAQRDPAAPTVLQQLCRAAGAADGACEDDALDALVARLGDERRQRRPAPLVVLDGIAAQHPAAAGLGAILRAAQWTRAFKLLLVGAPGVAEALAPGGDGRGERPPEIAIPPLEREQLSAYVWSWVAATLAPSAPPLVVSPDALLLLALRSGGVVGEVNRIAGGMLALAAADGRRALTSWHAWAAADRERRTGPASLPAAALRRPHAWPPPEVIDVIDACRRSAGMPPWPRGTRRAAGERGP
jgi:hypothetical protein